MQPYGLKSLERRKNAALWWVGYIGIDLKKIRDGFIVVDKLEHRAATSANQRLKDAKSDYRRLSDLLESYSFKCVLERGYSVIFDCLQFLLSVKHLAPNDTVELFFRRFGGCCDCIA